MLSWGLLTQVLGGVGGWKLSEEVPCLAQEKTCPLQLVIDTWRNPSWCSTMTVQWDDSKFKEGQSWFVYHCNQELPYPIKNINTCSLKIWRSTNKSVFINLESGPCTQSMYTQNTGQQRLRSMYKWLDHRNVRQVSSWRTYISALIGPLAILVMLGNNC